MEETQPVMITMLIPKADNSAGAIYRTRMMKDDVKEMFTKE